MTDDSSELPTLESRLTVIKTEIDKELLLLGNNLGENDQGLVAAMEILSDRITAYLTYHNLNT